MSIARCPVFVTDKVLLQDNSVKGYYDVTQDRIVLKSGYSKAVFAHEVMHSYCTTSSSSNTFVQECVADIGAYFLSKEIGFQYDDHMINHFNYNLKKGYKENDHMVKEVSLVTKRRLLKMGYDVKFIDIVSLIDQIYF